MWSYLVHAEHSGKYIDVTSVYTMKSMDSYRCKWNCFKLSWDCWGYHRNKSAPVLRKQYFISICLKKYGSRFIFSYKGILNFNDIAFLCKSNRLYKREPLVKFLNENATNIPGVNFAMADMICLVSFNNYVYRRLHIAAKERLTYTLQILHIAVNVFSFNDH